VFPRSTSISPYTEYLIPASGLITPVQLPPRGSTVSGFPYVSGPPTPFSADGLQQAAARWRLGRRLPTDTAGELAPHAALTEAPVGTSFAFFSTAPASVDFVFSKRDEGHKRGKRCVAGAGVTRAQRCVRRVAAGSFTVRAAAGNNLVSFDGALSSSKRLTPGSYDVSATATAVSSGVPEPRSALPETLRFTIAK
jgi:hypothetical protein